MQRKLTSKQEKFAQGCAGGLSQTDSYRAAYNAEGMQQQTIHHRAAELMLNRKVVSRIEELRKTVLADVRVTLEGHLDKLAELRDLSIKMGQMRDAITAEISRGKVSGLYVEKSQISVTTKELPASIDDLV